MSTAAQLPDTSPPSRERDFDFLAPERRQKFDLLLHLLANLPQLLLLCGPDGIGKSTFLRQLQDEVLPGWRVCVTEASEDMNFERLQRILAQALGLKEGSESALTTQLERMAAADEIVVLALDEGGGLLPGVLDAIYRFAALHPVLRVVVALRPDDLHVKAVTDQWAVEEAHVIEIPPLTELQTQDYIRSLCTRLGRTEPDEALMRAVYRYSHGIPARIRQEALERLEKPPLHWHRALARPVYGALAVVVLLVVALTYWQQQNPVATVPEQTPASAKAANLAGVAVQPDPLATVAASPPVAAVVPEEVAPPPVPSGKSTEKPLPDATVAMPVKTVAEAENAQELSPPREEALLPEPQPQPQPPDLPRPGPEAALSALGVHDANWLQQQEPLHFTLQIAAFDKVEDLVDFVRRYAQLQPLAYYYKRRRGRDWYSLLYGVFPTLEEARKAQVQLPADIGKPWLRRLRSVQKDIRAVQSH